MKKTFTITTILMLAMFIVGGVSAQNVVFQEPFNDSTATISSLGWQAVDSDGDGYNWEIDTYDNGEFIEIYVVSPSWDDVPLNTNNYLISPEIDLTGLNDAELEYFVLTADPDYAAEHYSVVVSTTGSDTSSFVDGDVILEETLSAEEGDWSQRTVSLSNYVGESIHIAWIHNSTDQYKLLIDSITIYDAPIKVKEINHNINFGIAPNPVTTFAKATFNLKEKSNVSYTIHDVTGRVVVERELGAMNGTNTIDINTESLTNGIYYMRLKHNDNYSVTKFVKQ